MEQKCYMESDMKQCCCQCKYRLEDHFYCGLLTPQEKENLRDMPRRTHKSITTGEDVPSCECAIVRGWICANPEFYPIAHSHWYEHSVGCECFTQKDQRS